MNKPEDMIKILALGGPPLRADEKKRYQNHAFGLLLLNKGREVMKNDSTPDAPFYLKRAYDFLLRTDFGNSYYDFFLQRDSAISLRGEIKGLWSRSYHSRGKYLHREGFYNQAEKAFLQARKLGFNCEREIKQVRDDIRNHPEKNKNLQNWSFAVNDYVLDN